MNKKNEMPDINELNDVFGVGDEELEALPKRQLDMDLLKKTIRYREGSVSAIEAIVSLIDEIEQSGVGYISVEELKETLFNAFDE